MAKTSSQLKGDKIKKAIADKGKTNFDKAFEKSSLSKSPAPGKTTSSNTGDGSGFKENLEYVAGVATRAAEKASELRRKEKGNDSASVQNAQSFQTNVNRINRENQFNDMATANNNAVYRESAARDNAKLDQFNANQRQDSMISQQRYENIANRENQISQSQEERASRAAQLAAQMKTQRNNQLLSLARGGL